MVDGNTKATLAPANYAITNVVSGESISIEQPAGQFDTAIPGAGKLIAVVLSNSDYRAGSNTLLANYQLRTGICPAMSAKSAKITWTPIMKGS